MPARASRRTVLAYSDPQPPARARLFPHFIHNARPARVCSRISQLRGHIVRILYLFAQFPFAFFVGPPIPAALFGQETGAPTKCSARGAGGPRRSSPSSFYRSEEHSDLLMQLVRRVDLFYGYRRAPISGASLLFFLAVAPRDGLWHLRHMYRDLVSYFLGSADAAGGRSCGNFQFHRKLQAAKWAAHL